MIETFALQFKNLFFFYLSILLPIRGVIKIK